MVAGLNDWEISWFATTSSSAPLGGGGDGDESRRTGRFGSRRVLERGKIIAKELLNPFCALYQT